MKKIAILLFALASMGFTVATENNNGQVAARPAIKRTAHTYGYMETSALQSYTLTLQ